MNTPGLKVLGLSNPQRSRPAAALVIDGEVVAAVEESRLSRGADRSHLPVLATQYCLAEAGIQWNDLDRIAIPWSAESYRRDLPPFVRRSWKSQPKRVWNTLAHPRRTRLSIEERVGELGARVVGDHAPTPSSVPLTWVDPAIALAAASYLLSGWSHAAIICLGGPEQLVSTFLAEGRYGGIVPVRRMSSPDSLELFFSRVTDYLGFNDRELTIGLSTYGRPNADMDAFIEQRPAKPRARLWSSPSTSSKGQSFRVRDELLGVPHPVGTNGPGHKVPSELVRRLGPAANGNVFSERYRDLAAAAQRTLEEIVTSFLETSLRPALEFGRGRVCLMGECALNPRLNRHLLEHPLVEQLWVPPAADDTGAALGAALWTTQEAEHDIRPFRHASLGPSYADVEIAQTLDRLRIPHRHYPDGAIVDRVAELIDAGEVVGWFQGRLEFGAATQGNRSVLAHPAREQSGRQISERLKHTESWHRFSPAITEKAARTVFEARRGSCSSRVTRACRPQWTAALHEAIHVDGTCQPHIVAESSNPRFHRLLEAVGARGGLPAVLFTSLNRPDEPIACSPDDALATFFGSGLDFIALGDRLVSKNPQRTS